jgi:glutamate racemase
MINTAIIRETNRLKESFLKNMNMSVPSYVIGAKQHFKFVNWVIDESLDSNLKLVNDITTISNERSNLESFEEYKSRQKMQRLLMRYRYMFTTDISTK